MLSLLKSQYPLAVLAARIIGDVFELGGSCGNGSRDATLRKPADLSQAIIVVQELVGADRSGVAGIGITGKAGTLGCVMSTAFNEDLTEAALEISDHILPSG
jgi:hypothetical protein